MTIAAIAPTDKTLPLLSNGVEGEGGDGGGKKFGGDVGITATVANWMVGISDGAEEG